MLGKNYEIWMRANSLGISLDFPLRQAKLSFSLQFIFFALLRRNPCLIEIVSCIYLSLFNFIRLSTAPRVTCHPDLVVYHWCHRTAAMKRIRALQCASFLRGGEFRGCFAKCMNVAVVKLKTVTFPFFFYLRRNLWLNISLLGGRNIKLRVFNGLNKKISICFTH